MPVIRVHLDTDLGGDPDDLCALTLLLRWPGVEITGITTCAEAGRRRAGWVRHALRLAGREEIPVAAGAGAADAPGRFRWPVAFPDEAEYWPEPVALAPGPLEGAFALLRRSIAAGARVVAIGPYTNLALFDEAHPGLLGRAPLFLMGGHVRPAPAGFPQWGAEMDFNVQFDPISAQGVLERHRPTLLPLEVTVQTALRRAYLPALTAAGPLGALLARQAAAHARAWDNEATHGRAHAGLPDDTINFQHDPLACAVALGWDGVTIEEIPLRPAPRDGWLRTEEDPAGRPLPVVTAVDGDCFNALWHDVVTGVSSAP